MLAGGVFRLSQAEQAARQPAPEVVLAEGLRSAGVDVRTVPLTQRGRIARSSDFDLVHVHHLSRGAVAAALSPLAAPLVFTAHSVRPPVSLRERAGETAVIRRMAAGVCLSNHEAKMRARMYPAARHKLAVLPNGLSLLEKPHKRRMGDHPRALFVGQLIPVKQLHRAFAAVASIPDLTLRLVFQNNELENELRRMASELGISERITFVGQLSGPALFQEYHQADFLVLPSLFEALPSVIIEALSTGLPIVASAVGGIPEQVAEAGTLVPSYGFDSFTDGVRRMLNNFGTFAEQAFLRSSIIVDKYSVDRMIESHLNLYQRVITGVGR